MTAFEAIGAVFGLLSVIFSTRRNVLTFPTGIVSSGAYGVVFYGAKLYSDVFLQVVFAFLFVRGWIDWRTHRDATNDISIIRVSKPLLFVGTASVCAITLLLGTFLAHNTDAAFPYVDSCTAAMSVFAQYLLSKRIYENWHVWIVADIIMIAMYAQRELWVTAGLYAIFLVLAGVGVREWRAQMRSIDANYLA